MKIVPLIEVNYLAPIIHDWIENEWGKLDILDYFKKVAVDATYTDDFPKTLVAISNKGKAMGTISILLDDMDVRPNLNPWLGCLFVANEFRNKSVARSLVASCEVLAYELEIKTLYLFTSRIEKLVHQSGWINMERLFFENEDVALMYKKIE